MTIGISSIVLYGDSQPDFSDLLAKGWEHPLGLRGEWLENSLVKQSGDLRFQIVRHEFGSIRKANWEIYTEIYVHHVSNDENKPILKGHGTPFTTEDILAGVLWLEKELEE